MFYFVLCLFTAFAGFSQNQSMDTVNVVYGKSDFVFIGKLKGFNEYQTEQAGKKNIIADFDVVEIYKGRRWNKVMVVTDQINLTANKDYMIYGIWGETKNKNGKIKKAGFFNSLRIIDAENEKALPEVVRLVIILKKKMFGRIKSPRAKIILRKCNCSHEKI